METDNHIARMLGDPQVLHQAFRLARLRAIRMHQISGEPLVFWRDGAMLYQDPDEALRQWQSEEAAIAEAKAGRKGTNHRDLKG